MKQVQKKHSAWLQTLLTVVLSVLIASAVWIGRYGVPLLGLPKAEDVQSVTLVSLDSGSVTVTDTENVELLVKAANLLNYKLGAPDTTDPELTVTYTLKTGKSGCFPPAARPCGGRAEHIRSGSRRCSAILWTACFWTDTTTMQKDKGPCRTNDIITTN